MAVIVSYEELDELIGDLKEDVSMSRNDDWPPVLWIRPVLVENFRDGHGTVDYAVGLVVRFHHQRRRQIWTFFYYVGAFSRLYGKYWADGKAKHEAAIKEVERLEVAVREYVEQELYYFQIGRALLDIGTVKLERGSWAKWENGAGGEEE